MPGNKNPESKFLDTLKGKPVRFVHCNGDETEGVLLWVDVYTYGIYETSASMDDDGTLLLEVEDDVVMMLTKKDTRSLNALTGELKLVDYDGNDWVRETK